MQTDMKQFITERIDLDMTKEIKNTATSLKSSMKQQTGVLDKIKDLIDVCEKENLLGNVDDAAMVHLNKYVAEMDLACAVVNKLADILLDKVKKKEDAEKAKKEKPAPKKETVKETPKEEPEKEDSGFDFDD